MNAKKSLFHKKETLVVAVLLILSLLANAVLAYFVFKPSKTVAGTYRAGVEVSPDAMYLVFMSDGSFAQYKQFEMIRSGGYNSDDGETYTLRADAGDQSVLYSADDAVYLFEPGGEIMKYSRISDIPSFFNVPDHKANN